MNLKVNQQPSNVTGVLKFDATEQPLLVGWEITVRAMSPARERGILTRASRNGKIDNGYLHELYAEECITDWDGFTPVMLDGLVEFDDDSERPGVDANGKIPFSVELAAFLLRYAPGDVLQNKVILLARSLLLTATLEKKRPSAGSSAA